MKRWKNWKERREIRLEQNEQDRDYLDYLTTHIANVKKAFHILREFLPLKEEVACVVEAMVSKHDSSKYDPQEYYAYRDYFYGDKEKAKDKFDLAWLHHQHNNPHHHQYWLLKQDDGTFKALDMPEEYIIEMICDWWAFSIKTGDYCEILNWYDKNRELMILSGKTRARVESILNSIKEKYGANE